ncbi:lrr receptor-like serine/threonine-protein kinase gso2 [Quercus suber]|uniref:Lrr receptor-like serine/threonine-protein kinase gso2 n=1 Tax=Quercus suber TaxID=58331 RepID=A0AAW0K8Y0_QUESU
MYCQAWNGLFKMCNPILASSTSQSDQLLVRVELACHIPSNFGKFSPSLNSVSFSNNSFSGELPSELCSGFSLQNFTVNNNFIGPLLEWLRNCSLLERVRFDGNNFNGNITNHNLSKNLLTGEIPQSLGSLVQLEELDLSENKLTGNIPKELGNCGRLLSLDLSNNNLLVEIQSELGNLNALNVLLDLSSNALSGTIPSNLTKLTSLEIPNISHNQLSGEIPALFTSMVSLRPSSIDFSYNKLTGQISTSKVLEEATANAYLRSSGLCGNAAGLSTLYTHSTKQNHSKTLLIAVLIPATEDFNEKYCIGKGGFGTIYRAALSTDR